MHGTTNIKWWTDIKRRKQNTQRKTSPSDIFTTTWYGLGSSLGRHDVRLVTIGPTYFTQLTVSWKLILKKHLCLKKPYLRIQITDYGIHRPHPQIWTDHVLTHQLQKLPYIHIHWQPEVHFHHFRTYKFEYEGKRISSVMTPTWGWLHCDTECHGTHYECLQRKYELGDDTAYGHGQISCGINW